MLIKMCASDSEITKRRVKLNKINPCLFNCLALLIALTQIGKIDCGQFPAISAYESNDGILTSLNVPPNSDINLNSSRDDHDPNSRYLLLLCRATYPIQWLYTGDGLPEFETNTSISWGTDPIIFMAAATLLKLSTYHTGNYTCRSHQNPNLSQYFYLYVTGDSLFTSSTGKTVTFHRLDSTVRIPCSLSNPKARVTLQKLQDGYVNCPLNDSISYNGKKGFTLKVTEFHQPQGEYLCIASLNGNFNFVQYSLLLDSTIDPQNSKFGSTSNLKCSQFPCGQNAHCYVDQLTSEARCRCDRHFHGDPYRRCHAECVLDIDCPSNRICNENVCQDPCPTACGPFVSLVQSCKVEGHRAICSYNSCNPSPCGPSSKCEDFHSHSRCSCLPGMTGSPPNCAKPPDNGLVPVSVVSNPSTSQNGGNSKFPDSPQNSPSTATGSGQGTPIPCTYNQDCPPYLSCRAGTCENPCYPHPCGRNTMCIAKNQKAVCKCSPGFIKVNQYCLPVNCRTPNDCPATKACVRNKCINPCAGYCGANSDCSVTKHLASCKCFPGFTGNPSQGCTRIKIPLHLSTLHSTPSPLPTLTTMADGIIPTTTKFPGPTPGIIQPIKNQFRLCGAGLTCGKNAKCEASANPPFCTCLTGFFGDPTRFCWQIVTLPQTESDKPETPGSPGFVEFGNILTASGTVIPHNRQTVYKKPAEGTTVCARNKDCPLDKNCVAGSCFDPCALFHPVCSDTQDCLVIDHNSVCRCKPQYPVKVHNNCFRPGNYSSLTQAIVSDNGQVVTKIKTESQSLADSPPFKKPGTGSGAGLPCVDHYECPELLACINKICKDPCDGACGILARCRVYQNMAKCFCPHGFFGNPRIRCHAPTFNSRLMGTQQGEVNDVASATGMGGASRQQAVELSETEEFDTTEINFTISPKTANGNGTGVKNEAVKGQEEKQKEKQREEMARYDDEYFDDSNEFLF